MKSIYVIGSLRNPRVPEVAKQLREKGYDVFDDWFSAGEAADDCLRDYCRDRGMSYREGLRSYSAQHIFQFDKGHLDRCDAVVMVLPCGRSCHLELGYVVGSGKPGYILMDQEPDRYDVMYNFATEVFMDDGEMFEYFRTRQEQLAEPRQGVLRQSRYRTDYDPNNEQSREEYSYRLSL